MSDPYGDAANEDAIREAAFHEGRVSAAHEILDSEDPLQTASDIAEESY